MYKLYNKVTTSGNVGIDDVVTLAQTYYNVSEACIAVCLSDLDIKEIQIVEDNVLHCLYLVKGKELNRKTILLAVHAYTLLGRIYFKQKKTEKAIQKYNQALELCLEYAERNNEHDVPIDLKSIILKSSEKPNGYKQLKSIYIDILRVLATKHIDMGEINKPRVIIIIHTFLATSIYTLSSKGIEESVTWIKVAMSLSDYFLMFRRFREAKDHLTVASFVKKLYIDNKYNYAANNNSLLDMSICEQYKTISMLFAIHWAKFGIALLRTSAARLPCLEEDHNFNYSESRYPTKSQKNTLPKLLFTEIRKEYPVIDMCDVPLQDKYLSDYSGAKEVFLFVLKLLTDASTCNNPEKDMMAFTTIIKCTYKAYRYMAFYEHDLNDRVILQKRSMEILSDAGLKLKSSKELRYLWLQLAIAYSMLIDTELENMEAMPYLLEHDTIVADIGSLVEKGLKNLQLYMNSRNR